MTIKIADTKELREVLEIDALLQKCLSQCSIDDLMALADLQRPFDEIMQKNDPKGTRDLFALVWHMELLIEKDAVDRLTDLRHYLDEWHNISHIITDLDEGKLEEKDKDQIDIMHRFLDNELHRKIELIQRFTKDKN